MSTLAPGQILSGEDQGSLPAQPSVPSEGGAGGVVEALAQFLHDECEDWPDKLVGATWPLHDGDDGYRGGGAYARLQTKDVVEHYRDIAARIVRAFPTLADGGGK